MNKAVHGAHELASQFDNRNTFKQNELSWGERYSILDVWQLLLDNVYVHLPLKRALYGFDPIRSIEHLRSQVPNLSDAQFHRELMLLINRLRDAHTQYVGPITLQGAVANLPFLVESYGPANNPVYVVSKVAIDSVEDPHFTSGVTLIDWNGVPIDRAVDLHADTETGGRPDARRARALESMTFRALDYSPMPDEQWVIVGYQDHDKRYREVRMAWTFLYPEQVANAITTRSAPLHQAINLPAESVRRAKKMLFNRALWRSESRSIENKKSNDYADFFTASTCKTANGTLGYLRIWSFNVNNDQGFIDAVIKKLRRMPDRGLIIDLRDNPGGNVWAAERMLQLLTPQTIAPSKFSMRATALTEKMARSQLGRQALAPWSSSLTLALSAGESYSALLPITSVEQCNDLGQHYGGPVVVVANANTYSAGDIFTAGIADNEIGDVVCIGDATGAGGANVWQFENLRAILKSADVHLPELPQKINLTVALRRVVRVGTADGMLIEDIGVQGQSYAMTENDLLNQNQDLMNFCGKLLANRAWTRLRVIRSGNVLNIVTAGLDLLDIYIDGHPGVLPQKLEPKDHIRFDVPQGASMIELAGFAEGIIRQRRCIFV